MIEEFLTRHGIAFERFDHVPVFTCEESEALPPMPGAPTKNLLLVDKKGERVWLVSVGHEKRVDLKALRTMLGVSGLSFASPELLKELLGVEPGSVTLLGLIHDRNHRVTVVLDQPLAEAYALQCHPLVNSATLVIPREGMARFFAATGHTPRTLDVPARAEAATA